MLTLTAIFTKIVWLIKRIAWFAIDNWRAVLPVVLILGVSVFVYRACNKPPKLDEKQIQKAQDAIAKRDRAEMERILAESDTAESAIDSNIKQIETDREAAKKSYSGYSNDELAAELERRK